MKLNNNFFTLIWLKSKKNKYNINLIRKDKISLLQYEVENPNELFYIVAKLRYLI